MKSKWNRNLVVMCLTIFLNLFSIYTYNTVLALYFRTLGADEWQIGLSFSAMGIAHTIFAIVGGPLADRYGRKMLIAIPNLLTAPLYAIAALADNWVLLLGVFIGTNMLSALTGPAFNALIAESSSEDQVARSFGYTEASVLSGLIVGPVAGALLLQWFDIRALIAQSAVVILLTSCLRAWALQETHRRATGAPRPRIVSAISRDVRWFIVLGTLLMMANMIVFGPFFSILARDSWHSSEAEINLLFAAGNAAALIGVLLGRNSNRWGTRRVFVLGALVYGMGAIAWGIAPDWQWGLVPLLIAFGFSEAAYIAMTTIQTEITTRETRTSIFGIIMTTTGLISGIAPSIGAWLVTLGGNPLPFIAAGLFAFAAIGAAAPIGRTRAARQQVITAQAE